jgi:hypothetical protein
MNATAVEKITPQKTEASNRERQGSSTVHQVSGEVGPVCAGWNWCRSFGCSWPCPKVALDAATRLRGHFLDPSLGQVGNLRRYT